MKNLAYYIAVVVLFFACWAGTVAIFVSLDASEPLLLAIVALGSFLLLRIPLRNWLKHDNKNMKESTQDKTNLSTSPQNEPADGNAAAGNPPLLADNIAAEPTPADLSKANVEILRPMESHCEDISDTEIATAKVIGLRQEDMCETKYEKAKTTEPEQEHQTEPNIVTDEKTDPHSGQDDKAQSDAAEQADQKEGSSSVSRVLILIGSFFVMWLIIHCISKHIEKKNREMFENIMKYENGRRNMGNHTVLPNGKTFNFFYYEQHK